MNSLNFGEVKQIEEIIGKSFGIVTYPTIIALTDPENMIGHKYEVAAGSRDMGGVDQLTTFLDTYANSVPNKKKINSKDNITLDFIELTEHMLKINGLCSTESSNICMIVFTDGSDSMARLYEMKASLFGYFSQDPITFTYINARSEPFIHQKVFKSS